MNEEMRKEFEDWCVKFDAPINKHHEIGEYINASTMACWMSWQASREAMKPIILPRKIKTILSEGGTAYNSCLDECNEAIQQAGYKVAE